MDERSSVEKEDETYELDLDDSMSQIDRVIEDAVAAVQKSDDASPEVEGSEAAAEPVDEGEDAPELRQRIEQLEAELKEAKDRSIRTLADFENFRKRTERERRDLRSVAILEPLRDFLGVADNIQRAMAASGSAEDLKLGLEMTLQQLEDMLRRYGVEKVVAVDQPFDPKVHEAVSRQETEGLTEPTVIGEMQSGYVLGKRLLRPSLVTVGVPVAAGEGSGKSAVADRASETEDTGEHPVGADSTG